MQKLVAGVHQFQKTIHNPQQQLFEQLAVGQSPEALFITCSDARVVPNLLTQSGPGDLFTVRNIGNVVPPYGASNGAESAAIEFAVSNLGIRDIIVCGHSDCGAVRAALEPERHRDSPAISQWLTHLEAMRRIIDVKYGDLTGYERMSAAVQENVLVQLEHLRTHPAIAAGLSRGEIALHGWVYKISTGEVFVYDAVLEQFRPSGAPGSDGADALANAAAVDVHGGAA